MKKLTTLVLIASAALLGGDCTPSQSAAVPASDPAAKEVVIVIPPGLPKPDFAATRPELEAIIKEAPAGTHFSFIEAGTPKLVAEISVPPFRYDTKQARERKLAVPVEDCMAKVESAIGTGGDPAIDLPAIMEHLASLHLPQPLSLLCVGSPLGELKEAPGWSIGPKLVPDDDQIATNSSATPWGTAEVTERLRGVSVRIWYPSPAIWSSHFQKDAATRFLAKWINNQGGALVDVSPDLHGTLKHLQSLGLPPVVTNLTLKLRGSLAMDEIEVPTPPVWMPTNLAAAIRLAANPEPAPLIPQMQGRVGLGLLWSEDADCDLYIWVKGQSQPIYFGNKTNEFARFGEDMRHGSREAEWTELQGIDRLEDIDEAYVNLYEGTGPVHGKVCFCWQGRTYIGDFSLNVTTGNRGGDLAHRTTSPYWARIDLRRLIANAPR